MTDTEHRIRDASFVAGASRVEDLPPPVYAEIAFAGRSNVGKSSLINRVLGRRKLVRTSSTPGCTRSLNLFRVQLADGFVDFVDLPGYGYAKRSRLERSSWGPMIEGFLSGRAGLCCLVIVVDIRRGLLDDDRQLLEYAEHLDLPVLIVATKLDKLAAAKRRPALEELKAQAGRPVMGFSAESGDGREPLWQALLAHVVQSRL